MPSSPLVVLPKKLLAREKKASIPLRVLPHLSSERRAVRTAYAESRPLEEVV